MAAAAALNLIGPEYQSASAVLVRFGRSGTYGRFGCGGRLGCFHRRVHHFGGWGRSRPRFILEEMEDHRAIFGVAAAVRESRGIALEEIARSTKIGVNYLRAIEGGEFGMLPGGIYNLSFIRQYARAVEFDEQELLRTYSSLTSEGVPDEAGYAPWHRRWVEVAASMKRSFRERLLGHQGTACPP